MSKAGGLVEKFSSALRSLGIRPPWQITGPVSSPEYLSHLPKAVDYRRHGPLSQEVQPIIPQADENLVYDIKYYTRDSRRQELGGGTKKIEKSKLEPLAKEEGEGASGEAVIAGKPYRWGEFRQIYDYENSGYTQ